ncbi:MAG: GNAT family N-acetyltransferase [Gammaproteobacteria bacterium]|nr:MAG: GNAT family N-acetyltransferase [Gammaproteobacteria bacterium]
MTIRNLEALFQPDSIVLIGASEEPESIGAVLTQNLLNAGFDGHIMLVNPKHKNIFGMVCYADVNDLPQTPDLAIIATPPKIIPSLVNTLGQMGTRGAVVITAGFAEATDPQGKQRQQQILDAAKPYLLRLIGPNCLGILVPGIGVNASFSHINAIPGKLAFVTQSGAIVTSMLDWAHRQGVGFSHIVSLGDMSDVDFGDMLDYLANDSQTSAILLYIEAISDARKFISAARAAAGMKPVIVVKSGRYAEGIRAAASHTGALAGSDAVYDAVFRRTGILRVYSIEELFDAAETLATLPRLRGQRLAILTNGGGFGVLAADSLAEQGGTLAELSEETLAGLDKVLPSTWSHGNPVDIIGDAPGSRYADALQVLEKDKGVDAILVINCPTAVASGSDAALAVIDSLGKIKNLHVLTSWVGNGSASKARSLLVTNHIPTYPTPARAVTAFMHVVNYRRGLEILMQTPPSIPEQFTADIDTARGLVEAALDEQRSWLTEPESKVLLQAYGIPVVLAKTAKTIAEAATIAGELGGPVALKILSPDIIHKSTVGGVALDLQGATAVTLAANEMLVHLSQVLPEANIEGFSVQPMVKRSKAYELIIGMVSDAQFGPILLFGQGGTAVEVINDKALGLPPLNMRLARELIARTRIHRLLVGYRDTPAASIDAIALTLIKVAQMVVDLPEIMELDINPLLADQHEVMALDARIRVEKTDKLAPAHLAIKPYPKELEESIPLSDGRTLFLRPIVPEDEPALRAAFTKLTPDEIHLRFFVSMKNSRHMMAARLTQLDYDRDMALILTDRGIPGKTDVYGVVRIVADPDREKAEYAVIVRHDMTGMGLGMVLMQRIIDYARHSGIKEIHGDVLRENKAMLKLCKVLGFSQSFVPEDMSIIKVRLVV